MIVQVTYIALGVGWFEHIPLGCRWMCTPLTIMMIAKQCLYHLKIMKSKVPLLTTRQNDFTCMYKWVCFGINACFVNLFQDHDGQGRGNLGTSQGLDKIYIVKQRVLYHLNCILRKRMCYTGGRAFQRHVTMEHFSRLYTACFSLPLGCMGLLWALPTRALDTGMTSPPK